MAFFLAGVPELLFLCVPSAGPFPFAFAFFPWLGFLGLLKGPGSSLYGSRSSFIVEVLSVIPFLSLISLMIRQRPAEWSTDLQWAYLQGC